MAYNNFTFSLDEIRDTAKHNRLLSLEIEPTLRCNYKCPYCYVAHNKVPDDELSFDELCDVIDQAHKLGARKIVILGGEPLIYPEIFTLIDFINSYGMNCELFSNGALLSADKAHKLFEHKVNLVLKLNSFRADVQASLTGDAAALEKSLKAIENARQAGYPAPDARLAISTIISNSNIDEMEQLWRYTRDNGFLPYFEMITPQGGANANNWLLPEPGKIQEVFEFLSTVDREYGHHWTPRPPLVGDRCMRHLYSCLVTSTGKVFPCVGIDEAVGNVRESPLKNIIHDSEIIQDLRCYADKIKGPCRSCELHSECFGCRGAAYQLTGDWLASDPLCWKHDAADSAIDFLPVDAGRFIPHQFPVRMIDTLDEIGEKSAIASVKVSPSIPFAGKEGQLADSVFMEMIAQTMAANDGFLRGAPCDGVIIGVNNYSVHAGARVGDDLKISIRKEVKFGNWGIVKGYVRKDDVLIAEGEIKVWKD